MGSIQTLALVWGAPAPTLQGTGPRTACLCGVGAREGPWLLGRCWLCTSSCNQCPPEEFLSLFPALIPSAHSSQGAPTELPGHGSDPAERFLALSEMHKLLPLHCQPTPGTRGSRNRSREEQLEQCMPSGISQEGRKEGVGGSRLAFSSRLLFSSPNHICPQLYFNLEHSACPSLLISACTPPELLCRTPGRAQEGRLCCLWVTINSLFVHEKENRGGTCPRQAVWD